MNSVGRFALLLTLGIGLLAAQGRNRWTVA
jgi:hypothetical protein